MRRLSTTVLPAARCTTPAGEGLSVLPILRFRSAFCLPFFFQILLRQSVMLQELPEVAVLPDIHHFLHMPRLSVPEARNPFSRTDAAPQHRDLVYPVKGRIPCGRLLPEKQVLWEEVLFCSLWHKYAQR